MKTDEVKRDSIPLPWKEVDRIVVFVSYFKTAERLENDEEKGRFYTRIFRYVFQKDHPVPDFSYNPTLETAWDFMKPSIDKSLNNRRPGNQNAIHKKKRDSNTKQNANTVYDEDDDNDEDEDDDEDGDKNKKTYSRVGECSRECLREKNSWKPSYFPEKYPTTKEEVLEICKRNGLQMEETYADLYLLTRELHDWEKLNGKKVEVGYIPYDLRTWILKGRGNLPKGYGYENHY